MKRIYLSCFILLSVFAKAQQLPIYWQQGTMYYNPNITEITNEQELVKTNTYNDRIYATVVFETLPSDAIKKELENEQVRFYSFVPPLAYCISFPVAGGLQLLQAKGVRVITFPINKVKLHTDLQHQIYLPHIIRMGGRISVALWMYDNTPMEKDNLIKQGCTIEKEGVGYIIVNQDTSKINALAALPFVHYIEPRSTDPIDLNKPGVTNHRDNYLHNTKLSGLTGNGVVIGIGDGGMGVLHVDFQNRQNNTSIFGSLAHSNHVTGTIGGAGIVNPLYKGMAPMATMLNGYYPEYTDNSASSYNTYGMVLTNNSWGYGYVCSGTDYNYESNSDDQQMRAYPMMSNQFAAGNNGASTCSGYATGFHTSFYGPNSAKNNFTVGALDDTDAIASFSSRGPAADGRIKPEICAVGVNVNSTIATNTYSTMSGTSMATPGVSGTMALLYEKYKSLHSGVNPDATLIKALLMNTADDGGNAGPDYKYGYGRINARRALNCLVGNLYSKDSVSTTDSDAFVISVPSNTAELKVMLHWRDKEANAFVTKTIVNDLDLKVIDPSSITYLPWVLDYAAANVNNTATRKKDTLNVVEQVTIANPTAGNYTLKVFGTTIPYGPQSYYITHEIVPQSIKLTYPIGTESFSPSTSERIRFDAYGISSGNIILEYSTDSGATWNNISSSISNTARYYDWTVPSVSSYKALVRVRHNTLSVGDTSKSVFNILGAPNFASGTITSCDRTVTIKWPSVTNANKYEVMTIVGFDWQTIATITDTFFTLGNQTTGATAWFTMRALTNTGAVSARATARSTTVSVSNCSNTSDVGMYALVSPQYGRKSSYNTLSSTQSITVTIRNYSSSSISNFPVSYQLNGGTAINETYSPSIAANSSANYTFTTTANMSSAGNYTLKIWTGKTTDNNRYNDTLSFTIRHLLNPAITSLPFTEGFESARDTVVSGTYFGAAEIPQIDYDNNSPFCRLRTYVRPELLQSGNRAITLDKSTHNASNNYNYFIYTLNLSNFSTDTKLGLKFYMMHHGEEKNTKDSVWVRGSDSSTWLSLYDWWANKGTAGVWNLHSAINIYNRLNIAGQSITSSAQIRIGQEDNSIFVKPSDSDGLTIDNITVYELPTDLTITAITSPTSGIGLSSTSQVKINILNNSPVAVSNIPVAYRVNNGSWVRDTLFSTLGVSSSTVFTFGQTIDLSTPGLYTLDAFVHYTGDSLPTNDSLIGIQIRNIKKVNTFPYTEGFESNNGYLWTESGNSYSSNWAWGVPAKAILDTAANGSKVWATKLSGNYDDNQLSYLYTPAFDLSSFSANPFLSFVMKYQTEAGYDNMYIEYSENNGTSWVKLGVKNTGTNWYNTNTNNWDGDRLYWKLASNRIPTASMANKTQVRFRFVFSSDVSANYVGVAVDDIHIYGGNDTSIQSSTKVTTASISGSSFVNILNGNNRIVSINPNGQNLGSTTIGVYVRSGTPRIYVNEKTMNRNWWIIPTTQPTSAVTVRLYLLESEYNNLDSADDSTNTIHDMGITKFDGQYEDSLITNNVGTFSYIPSKNVKKVPFSNGYYLEFDVTSFSEFWINAGGPNNNLPLPLDWINFTAKAVNSDAQLSWQVANAKDINEYNIERSTDMQNWKVVSTIYNANNLQNTFYNYTDKNISELNTVFYRINASEFNKDNYSTIQSVNWKTIAESHISIEPNPTSDLVKIRNKNNTPIALLQIDLYDMQGKLIKHATNTSHVSLSDLNTGFYILKTDADGVVEYSRVVKR